MLSNTLNTNEVKNSAGTEVEFTRLSQEGRSTVFAQIAETPNTPHRLKISHQESGTGINLRRRSVVRIDKTTAGVTGLASDSFYIVGDIAVGNHANYDEPKNILAELLSFCATTGAGTTVLFDGSGNGATALLSGSL